MVRKYIKSTKYKFVRNMTYGAKGQYDYWSIHITGVGCHRYESERAAAIAVDMYLIGKGKPPVNILKPL